MRQNLLTLYSYFLNQTHRPQSYQQNIFTSKSRLNLTHIFKKSNHQIFFCNTLILFQFKNFRQLTILQTIYYTIKKMFSKKFALVLAGLFAFVNCDAPVANHENSHHVRRQRHHHHRTTTQQTHTDAPHAHVATPHVEESHAHDHADNQLWEKDPNCAQWNSDRRCVRCAAKSYWDDGRCRQSSPTCKTFNEHNGACLTCFGGYQLQAGKCVVEQARQIDPLCHQFNEGHCTQCSRRAYFGKDHRCVNANPLCNTFDRHDGCCLSCYAGYRLNNGTCVVDPDFKGVRHVDEESHHETEHHNTQAPRVEVTVERTRQRRHRNSSQQRNRRQRQHHHSN